MSEQELKGIVFEIARKSADRGPGWAQESVVLRTIGEEIARDCGGHLDQETQQAILNAWHDLFLERTLAWGYDLDNPSSPFFHVRQ